ncbi:MAG TPA: TatD family hydrolase [Motiliproteus sp.]
MQPLPLFDTHCHLDFTEFESLRPLLLQQAYQRGVRRLLIPGVTADAWPRLLRLCADESMLLPALGLHPCFLDRHHPQDLDRLAMLLAEQSVVAVGEIGLDLWVDSALLAPQLELLEPQLDLAEQAGLPVLLHVRKAHDQMLARLRRRPKLCGGIVHAFGGSLQQARQYIELGFCLGIGGSITYPRATGLAKVVAGVPVEALVLETDAPDMPLYGFQGQANLPERLPLVLEALARVCNCDIEGLARQLWLNSWRVLRLDQDQSL